MKYIPENRRHLYQFQVIYIYKSLGANPKTYYFGNFPRKLHEIEKYPLALLRSVNSFVFFAGRTNHCSDTLLFTPVLTQLGLDRCRYLYSGAAPISTETLEDLAVYGIHVMELFGMSESTGTLCLTSTNLSEFLFVIHPAGRALTSTQSGRHESVTQDVPQEESSGARFRR